MTAINVPVTVVHSENDEFIKLEHAKYLAKTIPSAHFVYLEGVSHFASLQKPELINQALLLFLNKISHSDGLIQGSLWEINAII